MTAGIVGLGLIGGSLAKAYHEAGERVLAHDIDRDVLSFAVISGAVDEALTDETMAECDVILLAVRPAAAVEWLKNHAAKIDKHTVVIDCCGTKRKVCAACFPIAEQYGITYLGGHPMAGTQFSGFKYAKANLFVGAPMVLVPPRFDDIELLSHVKDLLSPAGFGSYSVTTAEQHRKARNTAFNRIDAGHFSAPLSLQLGAALNVLYQRGLWDSPHTAIPIASEFTCV